MEVSFTKLLTWVFPKLEVKIVMLGLDAAGKTTILYRQKPEKVMTDDATIGFNVETVEYKSINFVVWDVGGQGRYKVPPASWRYFFHLTRGLIYIVDSTDRERVDEAREWLHFLLNEMNLAEKVANMLKLCRRIMVFYLGKRPYNFTPAMEGGLGDALLLVFANKQDLPNAMNTSEITDKLELHSLTQHQWHVQSTCATSGEGLCEGLDWLSDKIASMVAHTVFMSGFLL